MKQYMTKAEFVKMFKTDELVKENKKDKPFLREYWNNWIDMLIKDGICRESAGNWQHLKSFQY